MGIVTIKKPIKSQPLIASMSYVLYDECGRCVYRTHEVSTATKNLIKPLRAIVSDKSSQR